jgi:hypothetical protein
MPTLPEGATIINQESATLPEGAVLLPQDSQEAQEPEQERGLVRSFFDIFTGDDRETLESRLLREVIFSPEFNNHKNRALRGGLLTASGDNNFMKIIKKQLPEATFRRDEKGNFVVRLKSGEYMLNAPGMSLTDTVQGVFDMALFTPAARAKTVFGAFSGSGATELTKQGVQQQLGGEINPQDIAISSVLGGATKGLENVTSTVRRVTTGEMSQADKELIKAGEKSNIPVLTSDLVKPKTSFGARAQRLGETIPFIGTGGLRAQQQEMREQAVLDFTERFNLIAPVNDVISSLKSNAKVRLRRAGGLIGDFRMTIKNVSSENTDKAIKGILENLTRKNILQDGTALSQINEIRKTLKEPQTFESFFENKSNLLERIRALSNDATSQMTPRREAMLNKVASAMKQDLALSVNKEMGSGAANNFIKANAVYTQEAEILTKTKIKRLLDKGELSPEEAFTMIFSKKPSESKLLYSKLDDIGKAGVKSSIIQRAFESSSKDGVLSSVNRFISELDKTGVPIKSFFTGKDKAELMGFKKLLRITSKGQGQAVVTKTGQEAIVPGVGLTAISDPVGTLTGMIATGLLSKWYESPVVRNSLAILANTPRGTTKFDRILSKISTSLVPFAQATRDELTEDSQ